jgi:hypothetical protein
MTTSMTSGRTDDPPFEPRPLPTASRETDPAIDTICGVGTSTSSAACVPFAWVHPVPFDCVMWARRHCGFKENPLFHASPELPCSKWCFSDLWQSMSEEVGYSVVYNCEKECAPDKAQWQIRHLLIQDKQIECEQRTQEILQVVMCDAFQQPVPPELRLAAHGRWPTERVLVAPASPHLLPTVAPSPTPPPAQAQARASQQQQQPDLRHRSSDKSGSDKRQQCCIQ